MLTKKAVLFISAISVIDLACVSLRVAGSGGRTALNGVQPDTDCDGIDDRQEQELGMKFAPQLRFHGWERYLPVDVDSYLKSCRLFIKHEAMVRLTMEQGRIDQTNLSQQVYSGSSGQGSASVHRSSESALFYLDLNENVQYSASAGERKCYLHVFPARWNSRTINGLAIDTVISPRDIVLQYWFLYTGSVVPDYSDVLSHEGDWEHVEVVVTDSGMFKHAIYFRHNYHSQSLRSEDLILIDNTHPVVFVALGTHASYERAGSTGIETEFGADLLNDIADNGDSLRWWNVWETGAGMINLGEAGQPMNGQNFILYAGRWGELGKLDYTSGPFGPAFNPYW